MNDKALVVQQPRYVTERIWQQILAIAPVATAARMFGVSEEQAAVVMMTGYELGLPLSASFDVIYVSKEGRRTLRPKGALALVRKSGLLEKFDWTSTNDSATVTMKRIDGPEKSMTLTIAEAQKAGWKSAAWQATPQNMLRWRLIGWLCDLLFPDVLLGLSIADDSYLNAEITPDGDVIEGTGKWIQPPVQQAPEPSPTQGQDFLGKLNNRVERKRTEMPSVQKAVPTVSAPPPEQAAITLNDLVARWGAERIVKALGTIPHNEEEMLEAERRLIAEDEKLESSDESTE